MKSIWRETPMPEFPPLDGDKKTDVLEPAGTQLGLPLPRLPV